MRFAQPPNCLCCLGDSQVPYPDSAAAASVQSRRNGRSSVAELDGNYRLILAGITAR